MTKKHFIKKHLCVLLAACLSVSLFAGCGKDEKNAESIETAENNTPDAENINLDASDDNPDDNSDDESPNIPDIGMLHPIMALKEIRIAKPNHSEAFSNTEWNTVSLSDEENAKYPELAKALTEYSNERDEAADAFSNDSKVQAVDYLDELRAELGESDEPSDDGYDWYYDHLDWPYYVTFEYQNNLNITRCDEIAFTVQEDYYEYMGGTHGYYAYDGANFDTKTGKELKVEDVIKDTDELNTILHDKLMSEYEDLMLEDSTVWEDLKSRASGEYDYNWLLGHDRVTFYFNPYALTAYAGGMQIIDIYFSEYPELFEEKYTKAPDEYVLHLGKNGHMALDMDGDKNIEKISTEVIERYDYYPEETDKGCSTVSITIDDNTDRFSMPDGYDGDTYYVHAQTGDYIYFISKVLDTGYLMCIDISDGYAKRVHRMCGFLPYIADVEYDGADIAYSMNESRMTTYTEAFTDTSGFALSSDNGSRALYSVGSDGMPVSQNTQEEAAGTGKISHADAANTDFAGTYWYGAYAEQLYDHIPVNERMTDLDADRHIDLFVYEDGTALLRSIKDNAYDAYACKGKWENDGRGGILFKDCTDPDGDNRDSYDSYLIPHIYPSDIEINGESGFLAMEYYDTCIYFKQDEMHDIGDDPYSGIDLSNAKKAKKVIEEDELSGEWVINSIRKGDDWVTAKNTDVVCTITIWDGRADFYYYSESGLKEQFYGMKLEYENENFSDENTKGYTLYAYPGDGTYEDDYLFVYFRIAPFGKSLMVQKIAESMEGESEINIIYYFSRTE